MEAMLKKLAKQLASMDEASLMALWETYHGHVKQFEPTHKWEEDCLIFGLIQTVRWKNQLFNSNWSAQQNVDNTPIEGDASPMRRAENEKASSSNPERGKVIRFTPREDM